MTTNENEPKKLIVICNGKSCQKDGSRQLLNTAQKQLSKDYQITTKFCFGCCGNGPIVYILPDDKLYSKISMIKLKLILEKEEN